MSTEDEAPARLPVVRVLAGIVAVVALVALGRQFGVFLDRFVTWVDGLGALGPAVFILGYVAATVAFIPGSVLTLAAGAIFGLGPGVVYVMVGATAGASLAFLLARSVAREAIAQRLAGNPRFAAIDRAVGREGLKIVLLLRLSPVFPFNLLNYGLGLTNVRFRDYVAASIGMLPGSFLYTYSGFVAGDLVRLAGDVGPERGPAYYAVVAVGLAADDRRRRHRHPHGAARDPRGNRGGGRRRGDGRRLRLTAIREATTSAGETAGAGRPPSMQRSTTRTPPARPRSAAELCRRPEEGVRGRGLPSRRRSPAAGLRGPFPAG